MGSLMRRLVPAVIAASMLDTTTAMHAQTAVQRREIEIAALRAVMADAHFDTLAATCVSRAPANRPSEPDSAFLAALRMRHRGPVVPPSRCPPTYETGERQVIPRPRPRPPGAIDPHILSIQRFRMVRARRARVEVRQDHRSQTIIHECIATRSSAGWMATCRVIGMAIA